MSVADIDAALQEFWDSALSEAATSIVVSPVYAAIFQAGEKFQGRDRRRIKREVRKAIRAARKSS